MAYVIVDDGSPESDEYDSNYLYFNERDATSILDVARQLREAGRYEAARQFERFNLPDALPGAPLSRPSGPSGPRHVPDAVQRALSCSRRAKARLAAWRGGPVSRMSPGSAPGEAPRGF